MGRTRGVATNKPSNRKARNPPGSQEVTGSIPVRSTKEKPRDCNGLGVFYFSDFEEAHGLYLPIFAQGWGVRWGVRNRGVRLVGVHFSKGRIQRSIRPVGIDF